MHCYFRVDHREKKSFFLFKDGERITFRSFGRKRIGRLTALISSKILEQETSFFDNCWGAEMQKGFEARFYGLHVTFMGKKQAKLLKIILFIFSTLEMLLFFLSLLNAEAFYLSLNLN